MEYATFSKGQTSTFFSAQNLRSFISSHKDKQKQLLVTHLNEATKQVCFLLSDDLRYTFTANSNFSLKDRIDFGHFTVAKGRGSKRVAGEEIRTFDADDFRKLYRMHSLHGPCKGTAAEEALDRSHLCRALVQSAMALRFCNTLDLCEETQFVRKKCFRCGVEVVCNFPTSGCLNQIKFFKSKNTTPFINYIIPQVLPCFVHLKGLKNNTSNNHATINKFYNEFLQSQFKCTSHALRKFLLNLQDRDLAANKSQTLGHWKALDVMKNHYLQDVNKFFVLIKLINSL